MLSVKYCRELAQTGHAAEEVLQMQQMAGSSGGGRVLDLGCGIGRHAKEWARRGYDYVGIDSDPELIAMAERSHTGVPGCRFRCDDVCRRGVLSLDRGRDIVTAVGRLVHFIQTPEELRSLFRNVSMVLSERGVFILDLDCGLERFHPGTCFGDSLTLHRGILAVGAGMRKVVEWVFILSETRPEMKVERAMYCVRERCPDLIKLLALQQGLFLYADKPGVGELSHLFLFARRAFGETR